MIDFDNILSNTLIVFVILLFGVLLISNQRDCTGIGGFVYKEIEWAQQTYNVIAESCPKESGVVSGLYYDPSRNQFFCFADFDCNDKGCRTKEVYLHPFVGGGGMKIDISNMEKRK